MRLLYLCLLSVLLAAASFFAPAAFTQDQKAPWLHADTGGEDAAVLEFSRGADTVSTILLRQGSLGSIRLTQSSEPIGVVVESMTERGDGALVRVYRLEDQYRAQYREWDPRPSDFLEEVELAKGGAAVKLEDASPQALNELHIRLVDAVLVTR